MTLSISPRANDIYFTFQDSCNCCRPKKPEKQQVYFNSSGKLEKYKYFKTISRDDRILRINGIAKSFQRSLDHLSKTLENKVQVYRRVSCDFSTSLNNILVSATHLRSFNMSHIEAINELMREFLVEKEENV